MPKVFFVVVIYICTSQFYRQPTIFMEILLYASLTFWCICTCISRHFPSVINAISV